MLLCSEANVFGYDCRCKGRVLSTKVVPGCVLFAEHSLQNLRRVLAVSKTARWPLTESMSHCQNMMLLPPSAFMSA